MSVDRFPLTFMVQEENREPVAGQSSYLVIGVISTVFATGPVPAKGTAKGSVGLELPGVVIRPNEKRPALRVVTPVRKERPQGV
jgi:hypothetical protein